MSQHPLPLSGITVLSIEQAVAAPFATRQLADLGARVIKVERPDGGDFARGYDQSVRGLSSYFVWLNRSKESLALDLKSATGQQALRHLVGEADVFVNNLAPGALSRLGIDLTALRQANQDLITCTISGYGEDGPWQGKKAYDLLVQAESGLLSLTGTGTDVARVGISIADIAAGMYAYSGVLTALLTRNHTGRGHHVSVSLFDAMAEWMAQPAYYTQYGGTAPARVGAHHATIAPYGAYQAGDGVDIVLAVQNEREWRTFCSDFLGRPSLTEDERFAAGPDRVRHRAELDPFIEHRLRGLTAIQAIAELTNLKIACGRVNDLATFAAHPVLGDRDRWQLTGTPQGPINTLLPPVRLSGILPRMDPVPALGQHTAAIAEEFAAGFAQPDDYDEPGPSTSPQENSA